METKKTNKANLENKKSIFLQLGFVITLSATILAFEWATPGKTSIAFVNNQVSEYMEEIVPITKHEEKRIEPPKPKPIIDLKILDNALPEEPDLNIIPADDITTPPIITEIPEEPAEPDFFYKVEEMPTFKNGGQEKFRNWVISNIKFPQEAAEMGLYGRITVKFIVNEEGQVCHAEILRGVDPLLDNEVLRVINSSPKWKPGKQRDKPVKVMFSFSIKFELQ